MPHPDTRAARPRDGDGQPERPRRRRETDRDERKLSPAQIARSAAQQFSEITGLVPTGIAGLERVDGDWQVLVEVVELPRIPDSTSVMAGYRVTVDAAGVLQAYRRERRYYRNQADDA